MIEKVNTLIEDTTKQIYSSIGKNGLIRKIYLLDKKEWYPFNKPDDYGDILPFVSVAENNLDFAKNQYSLWKKRMINGIPIPKHFMPLPPFLELNNIDDFIQGFSVITASFKNKYFLEEGRKISRDIIKNLQTKRGFYASVSLPFINIKLPKGMSALKPRLNNLKYYAEASSNGVVAENILTFGLWHNDGYLIKKGRECIDYWLNTKTFKKHSLFPEKAFPKDSTASLLPKGNTNLGYALLASIRIGKYKYHEEQLKNLIRSIEKNFAVDGGYADYYDKATRKKSHASIIGTNAFCRLLMDSSFYIKKEYWDLAYKTAFNIAEMAFSSKNNIWKEQMYEDDGVGDFANVLMLLDKERKHKVLLKKIFSYLIKKFYLGKGLWKDYFQENGPRYAHSKYLGGVLKYLVCYKAYLKKENMLSKKWFFVSQDR